MMNFIINCPKNDKIKEEIGNIIYNFNFLKVDDQIYKNEIERIDSEYLIRNKY